MVARLACAGGLRWAAVGLFTSILTAAAAFASPPQEQQEQVRAFLEAGEFAPAVDLARQTTDLKQRDALLGQMGAFRTLRLARDSVGRCHGFW